MGKWCGQASQEETMGEGCGRVSQEETIGEGWGQVSQEETMGEDVVEPHRRKPWGRVWPSLTGGNYGGGCG